MSVNTTGYSCNFDDALHHFCQQHLEISSGLASIVFWPLSLGNFRLCNIITLSVYYCNKSVSKVLCMNKNFAQIWWSLQIFHVQKYLVDAVLFNIYLFIVYSKNICFNLHLWQRFWHNPLSFGFIFVITIVLLSENGRKILFYSTFRHINQISFFFCIHLQGGPEKYYCR